MKKTIMLLFCLLPINKKLLASDEALSQQIEEVGSTETNTFKLKYIEPLINVLQKIDSKEIHSINIKELEENLIDLYQDNSEDAVRIKEILDQMGHISLYKKHDQMDEFINKDEEIANLKKLEPSIHDFNFNEAIKRVMDISINLNNKDIAENKKFLEKNSQPLRKKLLLNSSDLFLTTLGVVAVKKLLLNNVTRLEGSTIINIVQIGSIATFAWIIGLIWIKVKNFIFGETAEKISQANLNISKAHQEIIGTQNEIALIKANQEELKKLINQALKIIGKEILPVLAAWENEKPKQKRSAVEFQLVDILKSRELREKLNRKKLLLQRIKSISEERIKIEEPRESCESAQLVESGTNA